MRQVLRFLKITAIPLVLAAVICFWGTFFTIRYKFGHKDFKLPENVHVLAIGHSQIMATLNDSILTGWRNMGCSAQHYMEEVKSLDRLLSANAQIDTVVVGVSLASFIKLKDKDFLSRDYPNVIFHMASDVVDPYVFGESLKNPNFYTAMMTSWVQSCVGDCKTLGEYSIDDFYILEADIDKYKTLIAEMGGPGIDSKTLAEYNKNQMEGLHRLIDVCDEHGVTPVLMVPPMYGFDTLVDNPDTIFKELIQELGDSINVADYQRFRFPDSCRYKDVVHIDSKASNYFSQYLKDNGMRCVYMKDYVRN